MKTYILRHRRENLKKCSLSGLEKHPDLEFFTYPVEQLPDLPYLILKVGAPPLSKEDADKPLLLIDGTWKLALTMEKNLPKQFEARSLPGSFRTAYPRRQTDCPDPNAGLSSVEALYLVHHLLGKSTEDLFRHYYWKEQFFTINPSLKP